MHICKNAVVLPGKRGGQVLTAKTLKLETAKRGAMGSVRALASYVRAHRRNKYGMQKLGIGICFVSRFDCFSQTGSESLSVNALKKRDGGKVGRRTGEKGLFKENGERHRERQMGGSSEFPRSQ